MYMKFQTYFDNTSYSAKRISVIALFVGPYLVYCWHQLPNCSNLRYTKNQGEMYLTKERTTRIFYVSRFERAFHSLFRAFLI